MAGYNSGGAAVTPPKGNKVPTIRVQSKSASHQSAGLPRTPGGSRAGRGGGGKPPTTAGPTDWLAPMTQAQIAAQAQKTVDAMYKPQFTNLDQQSTQAQAVSAKRAADNKYYLSWLQAKMGEMQAQNNAANQALVHAAGITDSTIAGASTTPGLEQPAGSVEAGAQRQALENMNARTQYMNGLGVFPAMLISAAESKQMSDLNTTLTGIANNRTKLQASEGADLAKEVARLMGVEIQKAQSNRDYSAAVAKLNLTAAQDRAKNALALRGQDLTRRGQDITIRGQDINSRLRQIDQQLKGKTLDEKTRHDLATERTALLRAQQTGQGRNPTKGFVYGGKPPSAASSNATLNAVDQMTQWYNRMNRDGQPRNVIWQLLLTGGHYKDANGHTVTVKPLAPKGSPLSNVNLANAAFDIVERGGLSQGSIDAFHSHHILIGKRFPLRPTLPTGAGQSGGGVGRA